MVLAMVDSSARLLFQRAASCPHRDLRDESGHSRRYGIAVMLEKME